MGTKERVKKLEGAISGGWAEYEQSNLKFQAAICERMRIPFNPEKIRQSVQKKMKKYKTPEDIQLSPLGKEILQKHGIEVD